jgi:hypothetical protein
VAKRYNSHRRAQQDAAFCVSDAYDWRKDAQDSFHLALHLKALALGHKRPSTPAEFYYCEAHGAIP